MRGFWALFRRECKRFIRVFGQTVLTPIMSASLYLLIFGLSLGAHIPVKGDLPYLLFLIPGLLMMGVLNNSFQNSSGSIITSKFHGDLEDLKTTPLSSHQIVWAMSLAGLFRGALVASSIAITSVIFAHLQGLKLTVQHLDWLVFFVIMGGISFAQLGLVVGFFAKSFDQLNAFGMFVLLPLIYLGGVFFSLDNLHPFWAKVAAVNPLLYYINGLRYAILGVSDFSVLTATTVALIFLAITTSLSYTAIKHGRYHRF